MRTDAVLIAERVAKDTAWLDRLHNYKHCAACRRELPLDAFGTRAKGPNGYVTKGRMSNCRPCDAARKRAERARLRDAV